MTYRFYNPYFFLPVLQGRSNDDQCVEFAEIRKGKHDHIRHDFYHPGYNTGYIVCTLTTKTPTFIGNERTGGIKNRTPGEAKHYEVNGKPAFPANSLNGMIGSLMEALGNSALRVLEKRPLSKRKSPEQALSAIGMVTEGENGLMLRPLTLPTLRYRPKGDQAEILLDGLWLDLFSGVPLKKCLSVYVPKSDVRCDTSETVCARLRLDEKVVVGRGSISAKMSLFKTKTIKKNGEKQYFILAQHGEIFSKNSEECIEGKIKKLLLSGLTAAQKKMHCFERFVPFHNDVDPIPIPPEVLDTFEVLAREANERDSNFPLNQPQFRDKKTKLLPDMLVFFDIREKNGVIEVSEISHSSIWRERFDPPDTIHAFEQLGNNLLPWKGARTHLTPAEQILGVVAEEEDGGDGKVHSLAGRIRFSDALPVKRNRVKTTDKDHLLKILSSPKPPSEYLYFHKKADGQNEHGSGVAPNGRKYYLHQQQSRMELENDEKQWWETKEDENDKINYYKNIHQKTRCRPVATGQEFRFRICFHNLNDAELGLLLAALDPVAARAALDSREEGKTGTESSSGKFLHRLGFGKPLGLGAVKIEITQLMMENVEASYTSWTPKPVTKEKKDCIDTCLKAAGEAGLIDEKALEVLLVLGDPGNVKEMVTYPVTRQQYDALVQGKPQGERELFRWFGKNKKPENRHRLVKSNFWQQGSFTLSSIKLPALNGSSGGGGGGGNRSQKKGGKGNQTGGASGD